MERLMGTDGFLAETGKELPMLLLWGQEAAPKLHTVLGNLPNVVNIKSPRGCSCLTRKGGGGSLGTYLASVYTL